MRWPEGAARALPAALLALAVADAVSQRPEPDVPLDGGQTPAVFRRFAPRVFKLQVVEIRSGARQVTGSGFYVGADGRALTNYHVVADLVREPDRYRAEIVEEAGGNREVRVEAVDVVHDLAVLATGSPPPGWFHLSPVSVVQGLRLYALGHPGDLGLAIVEGTYNGRLPHTLYPRIHFTGAINPGMSGGPTITLDGRVVGISVATAGNQRGFLVPVDDAVGLLNRAASDPAVPVESLLADVGRQLLAYQEDYLARLFTDTTPTVTLGSWSLPTRPSDVFDCWGETDDASDQPYVITHHSCSTGDDVYLSSDQSSGIVEFEHDLLTSDELNRFRFHSLYTSEYRSLSHRWGLERRGDDEVTGYRCHSDQVRRGDLTARAVFCARRYKRLPGLYDVVFRVATIGEPRAGVLSTLTLSGVSFENALALVRRYLQPIRRAS